jgi:hypothetical protein
VFTVDILGRKNIQMGGFVCMTTFMAAMAGSFRHLLNPNNHGDQGISICVYIYVDMYIPKNAYMYIYMAGLFRHILNPNNHGDQGKFKSLFNLSSSYINMYIYL